jgi:hypothetical protein
MKIKEIEKDINKKEFKEKVRKLFSDEVSAKINLDFQISASFFCGNLIKVEISSSEMDSQLHPIPNLFAIVSCDMALTRFEKQIIKQFATLVEVFENGYFLNDKNS